MAGKGRVCGGMHAAGRAFTNMSNLDACVVACMQQDARSLIWQVLGRVCGGMQYARSLIWQVVHACAVACTRQDARSLIWQVH
jgi:hypothetical protein